MFWKLTNENECHHSYQYHDGLNVDPVPFAGDGDCVPGGLYYAGRDVLAFCAGMTWVREATVPAGARWVRNPGSGLEKFRADRLDLGPRRPLWNAGTLQWLVAHGADVHACEDDALRWAAGGGRLECVQWLKERGEMS